MIVAFLCETQATALLTLLSGQDKNTYIRALKSDFCRHKCISFRECSDLANLTREDISFLKTLYCGCD